MAEKTQQFTKFNEINLTTKKKSTMETLKQISAMSPLNYKVIDNQVRKGEMKDWNDQIEIMVWNGSKYHSKFCTRKFAYKYGLAEKP